MTSEERFTTIENALTTVAENQARQAEDIGELRQMHKSLVIGVLKLSEISTATDQKLKTLIETVQEHEGKIDALIDTVDRIVRHGNGKE